MSIRLSSPSNKRRTLTSTLLRSISVFVYTHMSRIARTLTSTPLRSISVFVYTHMSLKREGSASKLTVPSLSPATFAVYSFMFASFAA